MIEIKTIPHTQQRYQTVGDYWEDKDGTHIRVSALDDLRYEYLITIHEVVEYFLVKLSGIPISEIDAFDIAFSGDGEPGDDPKAPYFMAHQIATLIERTCAFAMGVLWKDYEKAVESVV